MTTFTAWRFDRPNGAGQAFTQVKYAAADELVTVLDHAIVSWPDGADAPTIRHRRGETWRGAGWSAFWGTLIGSLFFVPIAGGVVGAGIGAARKRVDGTGITRDDLEKIRTSLGPGSSALFLVTENSDLARLGDRFLGLGDQLVATDLSEAEREALLKIVR